MVSKNKIIGFLTNPFILSIFFTIPVLIIPDYHFPKYKTEVIQLLDSSKTISYYEDLDMDGQSEEIKIDNHLSQRVSVLVYSKNKIIDQWNFEGEIEYESVFFEDINSDGNLELILFVYHDDLLNLEIISPMVNKTMVKDRVVSKITKYNHQLTYEVLLGGCYDNNGDTIKELYFFINSGFITSPRQLFYYDIVHDSIFISQRSCMSITGIMMVDLNGDNKMELLASKVLANGNCNKNEPFSDWSCWLTVFNSDISFMFPPVKVGSFAGYLNAKPIIIGGETYILFTYLNHGINDTIKSFIGLCDVDGNIVKTKNIENHISAYSGCEIIVNRKNEVFVILNDTVYSVQKDLNLKFVNTLPYGHIALIYLLTDLNNDGLEEYLFMDQDGSGIIIVSDDFKHVNIVKLTDEERINNISIKKDNPSTNYLYVDGEKKNYEIKYSSNPYYFLHFAYYPLIYLLVLSVISVITRIQTYRLLQTQQKQKAITKLQLNNALMQIEPHFALNIMNSLNELINKENKDKADEVFKSFSNMLRFILVNSENITVSLKDELSYIEDYLKLMRFKCNDRFDFIIECDGDLNIYIPKLLLFTFVENAVKHGVFHLKSNGMIKVSIHQNSERKWAIDISDNGIGREKSSKINTFSTGKGLLILNRLIDYFNQEHKFEIKYKIEDLNHFENTGVKVKINIEKL